MKNINYKFTNGWKSLSTMAVICSSLVNPAQANINQPQEAAIGIFSRLQNDSQINYINTNYWLQGEGAPPSFSVIRNKVLDQQVRYFIDFSTINEEVQKKQAKLLFRNKIGLAFTSDFLIISKHKGRLLFTPLDDENDPNVSLLEASSTMLTRQKQGISKLASGIASETHSLPHVAFYLNVNRPITNDECTFKKSHLWNRGESVFCDNPNISLIYRVNLERSLQYGTTGSATPDAKIVRISLDDDTTGAGVHLNERLEFRQSKSSSLKLRGYFKDWSTDAIAQDYQFSFNASNSKAHILKTFPRENLNAQYEVREVSGFEIGVASGVEVGKDGPKAKLEANASYNQSRWLTFNTQDYRVERYSPNAQNVQFKWNRDQFATAKSLLDRSTDAPWVKKYPVDINRINPIGYASFVPKMDVIYKAAPNAVGTTDFTIDSSVNIRPIYNGAYRRGLRQSYRGFENTPRRRVGKKVSFTVDWEHPVFTGGRPVNLQLGSFNNRCVDMDDNGVLMARVCEETKNSQSFIFDQLGRYVSASDVGKCLDGASLKRLQDCDSSLSQRWEWIEGTDKLSNVFSDEYLGHNKVTGELGLYSSDTDQVSFRTITSYTNVFSNVDESLVFGFTSGSPAHQDVGPAGTLYIRHSSAIDAIGTQENAMQGGIGGSLTQIDLNRVAQITATSGKLENSGSHLLSMAFTFDDGSIQVLGSKNSAFNTDDKTFELPDGASIRQVKIWSQGEFVDGIKFIVN
ncbi:leukocidin family pore-forming toxin [Vibrio paucivorans]